MSSKKKKTTKKTGSKGLLTDIVDLLAYLEQNLPKPVLELHHAVGAGEPIIMRENPPDAIPLRRLGDKVNHPEHYNKGKIECIEYLEDQFMSRPHECNAVMYFTRASSKGKEVEDLEKAIWYLRRRINLIKGKAVRPNEMPQERA